MHMYVRLRLRVRACVCVCVYRDMYQRYTFILKMIGSSPKENFRNALLIYICVCGVWVNVCMHVCVHI
jgi:hypothetical protein